MPPTLRSERPITCTLTESLTDSPLLFVAFAVIWWVPSERLEELNDSPEPIDPSRLDVHSIAESLRIPSSGSNPSALKDTESFCTNIELFSGVRTVTFNG